MIGKLTGLELRANNIYIPYRDIFPGKKAHKYWPQKTLPTAKYSWSSIYVSFNRSDVQNTMVRFCSKMSMIPTPIPCFTISSLPVITPQGATPITDMLFAWSPTLLSWKISPISFVEPLDRPSVISHAAENRINKCIISRKNKSVMLRNRATRSAKPIWKGWISRLKTAEVSTNGKQLACHTQQNLIQKLATLT